MACLSLRGHRLLFMNCSWRVAFTPGWQTFRHDWVIGVSLRFGRLMRIVRLLDANRISDGFVSPHFCVVILLSILFRQIVPWFRGLDSENTVWCEGAIHWFRLEFCFIVCRSLCLLNDLVEMSITWSVLVMLYVQIWVSLRFFERAFIFSFSLACYWILTAYWDWRWLHPMHVLICLFMQSFINRFKRIRLRTSLFFFIKIERILLLPKMLFCLKLSLWNNCRLILVARAWFPPVNGCLWLWSSLSLSRFFSTLG